MNSFSSPKQPSGAASGAIIIVCASLLLSACSGFSLNDLNPFSEKETKLKGTRESVMVATDPLVSEAGAASAIALPPARDNAEWAQPGGVASNAPGHLALASAPRRSWRTSAVSGSDDVRLSITPIVYQGRIYVVDTEGDLYAFTLGDGRRVWKVNARPKHEDDDGVVGGGVAADGGQLFLASPYRFIAAYNPASGAQTWKREISVPLRGAPTAAGGKVFAVTADNRVIALNAADGTIAWEYTGIAESTGLLGNSSPAVSGNILVVPYSSGEIIAFDITTGEPIWVDSLSRSQRFSSVTGISEVAGRPAVDRGVAYAVSVGGRLVAVNVETGERVWSRNIASVNTPVVAGDSVFVNAIDGRVVAFSRVDGKVQWVRQLENKDDDDSINWAGPVLGGGRLWLVSSHEHLVSLDAATGAVTADRRIGDSGYISPIVAGRKLILLTDDGALLAYN